MLHYRALITPESGPIRLHAPARCGRALQLAATAAADTVRQGSMRIQQQRSTEYDNALLNRVKGLSKAWPLQENLQEKLRAHSCIWTPVGHCAERSAQPSCAFHNVGSVVPTGSTVCLAAAAAHSRTCLMCNMLACCKDDVCWHEPSLLCAVLSTCYAVPSGAPLPAIKLTNTSSFAARAGPAAAEGPAASTGLHFDRCCSCGCNASLANASTLGTGMVEQCNLRACQGCARINLTAVH